MASPKAPLFDPLLFKQAHWSKAFAHPARIIILEYLLHHGTTPFYTLARLIPLAKTTVSQHLKSLREAGLVDISEKYPHSYYSIKRSVCTELAQALNLLNKDFLEKNNSDGTADLPVSGLR